MITIDERTKQLAENNIPSLLLRLSIPATIGMFIEAFYNIVGRMFVGRADVGMAGPVGLAAITICFPFMMIMMAFTLMLGAGGAARISLALGRNDKETAEKVLATGFTMAITIGLIYTVLGQIFIDPLLRLFGADEITMPYARLYMSIILYGAIPNMLTFALNRYIMAQGRAMFALTTLIISTLVNLILTPIFIYVFHWGVAGAARATVIAWSVSAIWVVLFYVRGKGILRLRIRWSHIRMSFVLSIFSIGIAPFTLQIVNSISFTFLNNSLRIYGTAMAISAMGAIQSCLQFFQMPLFGLNQGSQPIMSFNYGAGNFERVRKTLRLVILTGTSFGILAFTLIMTMPRFFIGLFGNDPEMLAIGERSIRIFLMMIPVIGVLINGSNFFTMTGRPHKALMITLTRQIILITGLMIFPRLFNLDGVFIANPVADIIAFTIGITLITREMRRLKRLESPIA